MATVLRLLPALLVSALGFGLLAPVPTRAQEGDGENTPPIEVLVPLRGVITYIQPGPQPTARVEVGSKVTLAVPFELESDAVVQWFRDGVELNDVTGPRLELGIVDTHDDAFFTALPSSTHARYAPLGIQLDVVSAHGRSRLLNSSLRGGIAPESPRLIGGVVLGEEPRHLVLVRAVGPALATLGVANPLPDPEVHLFDAAGNSADGYILSVTTQVVGSPTIKELVRMAGERVGAFPLPEDGNDVAFLVAFPAGAFTAHVTSRSGATGEVLLEFYDVPDFMPGF